MLFYVLILFFYDFRPIPDREYVEAYVKAYYLPETQLEIWLRDHKVSGEFWVMLKHAEKVTLC